MVRQKRDFQVVDAKTGEDITRSVLTQIIMDEESRGSTMLPVNFLRQLISMYGDQMQAVVPQYLEASLDQLQRNQSQLRETMAGAFAANPFAEIARRNMEMFTAAASGGRAKPGEEAAAETTAPAGDDTKAELAGLKAQLAELQKQLDKLSG
jgi:polyhydroxyalkanoate synthesis repressor PhaR